MDDDNKKNSFARRFFAISVSAFLAMFLAAKIFGLMRNSLCFAHLGCNVGFFGYDAAVHFVSGLMIASGLVWIFRRNAGTSMLSDKPWKNIVITLALAALIGVGWEMLEFIYDHIRMDIFHVNLTHPNQMAQASNSDTMGDLSFSLLGTYITVWLMKLRRII